MLDRGDPAYAAVAGLVAMDRGPLLLSPFVLQELDYLLAERISSAVALRLLDDVVSGAYRLEPFDASDLGIAVSVMRRYADMPLGLADSSVVVLAARHGTDRILSLDERHFRTVRPLQGGAFTILPADA